MRRLGMGLLVLLFSFGPAAAQLDRVDRDDQDWSDYQPATPPVESSALGTIIYVDASAGGANNGTSWTNAYTSLQSALTDASMGGGTQIWVADGVYKPAAPGGARTATFAMVNAVKIYGGFAGSETLLSQRDPETNLTVLSGDLNGDDVGFTNNGENVTRVVSALAGVSTSAALDGFTITGANANTGVIGGGIFINNGAATIVNCTITGNTGTLDGGGAAVVTSSGTAFHNCRFLGNGSLTMLSGGGAYVSGTTPSAAFFVDCVFQQNQASGGGAVNIQASTSHARFINCAFIGNSANGSGAIDGGNGGTIVMTNCTFRNNTAVFNGGAFSNVAGDTTISNCTFANNTAGTSGGAIRHGNFVNSLGVRNCIFWGNSDASGMTSAAQISIAPGANNPTVDYSIVQGGWAGPGANNLSSDPLFVDAVAGDLRVLSSSPAVDSGRNSLVPPDVVDLDGDLNFAEPTPVDLGNSSRFVDNPYVADTGLGAPPLADRGAYETQLAGRVYVDEDGLPGVGEWANAYADLQDGLRAAQAYASAEVWVAGGRYPTAQAVGDRSATFTLRNRVGLYGGFAGHETLLTQRDPLIYFSILTGDLAGDDGPDFANYSENSYHVVSAGELLDASTVLDGFTITGGNADSMVFPDNTGGGIHVSSLGMVTSPTIANCVIKANSAVLGGGGLKLLGDVSSTIQNCVIRNNRDVPPGLNGGGVQNTVFSVVNFPKYVGCLIEGNTAQSGGGMSNNGAGGMVELRRCTLRDNVASQDGGGFYNSATVVMIDCVFDRNMAFDTSFTQRGGGIASPGSGVLRLHGCTLTGNSSEEWGGGIYLGPTGTITVTNTVFSGNHAASQGGAIQSASINNNLSHCTIHRNTAGQGGGVYYSGATGGVISNSIFWQNSDVFGMGATSQIRSAGVSPTVDYTLVQGGWAGPEGNNLNVDPAFPNADGPDGLIGTADDDLSLAPSSPCIDRGNSTLTPADGDDVDDDGNTAERIPLDAARHARFYDYLGAPNTGVAAPPYPMVDLGALEFIGDDCNANGIPDDCDLACGAPNGPCDVPGCGGSVDADMNGFPDDCADFIGACGVLDIDWSCANNWNIPGDVYPDNVPPISYAVTLDGTDHAFLDVDVTIDSLTITDQAILDVTQTGSVGDLTIAGEGGILVSGSSNQSARINLRKFREISVLCGPVTVINGEYAADPTAPDPVSATMNCELLAVRPGGVVRLEDTMQIAASEGVLLLGSDPGLGPCTQDGGKTPPVLQLTGSSAMDIGGDLELNGSVSFVNRSAAPSSLAGDFANLSDTPECVDCSLGSFSLNSLGAQSFEVGGEDLGATFAGFAHPMNHSNYSLAELEIAGGTNHRVVFENTFANVAGSEACNEALYVRRLTLRAGAVVVLNNVKVYYQFLVNEGATITTVGCGQLISLGAAVCATSAQCDDDYACTYDSCTAGACAYTPVEFGNVNGLGPPAANLDDLLCVLAGFSNAAACPNADIAPCVGGNDVINLDDILVELAAFSGSDPCNCEP